MAVAGAGGGGSPSIVSTSPSKQIWNTRRYSILSGFYDEKNILIGDIYTRVQETIYSDGSNQIILNYSPLTGYVHKVLVPLSTYIREKHQPIPSHFWVVLDPFILRNPQIFQEEAPKDIQKPSFTVEAIEWLDRKVFELITEKIYGKPIIPDESLFVVSSHEKITATHEYYVIHQRKKSEPSWFFSIRQTILADSLAIQCIKGIPVASKSIPKLCKEIELLGKKWISSEDDDMYTRICTAPQIMVPDRETSDDKSIIRSAACKVKELILCEYLSFPNYARGKIEMSIPRGLRNDSLPEEIKYDIKEGSSLLDIENRKARDELVPGPKKIYHKKQTKIPFSGQIISKISDEIFEATQDINITCISSEALTLTIEE